MSPLPYIPALSDSFIVPKRLIEKGSATLVDLYDWNAEQNPDHPLFRFHDGSQITTICWKEAVRASHRAAQFFTSLIPQQTITPVVVGVLANTDTVSYFTSIMGMFRAGFTVFTISTRNSADAVRHLLTATNTKYLLISQEPGIVALAEAALKDGLPISIYHMPEFADIYVSDGTAPYAYPSGPRDPDAPTLILHSSGSTAFPKPIVRSARRLLEWTLIPWYGEINLTGLVMACHVLPMFHGMGVLQLATTASCGLVISAFKPSSPAVIPTPINVLDGAKATNSDMICSVPSLIEMWAQDPANVNYMKNLKGLIFGGGPLAKGVGDMLASHGVCLYTSYGSTEAGVISRFFPAHPGTTWDHMVFSEQMSPEFMPIGDGTYELVLVAHDGWTPLIVNTKVNGKDAFSTNDLFIPHENKSGLWKIYGRTDDQIMLSTGEKTNPGPLENIISQDPHVQTAVMFGRGRLQNGILVEPKKQFSFDTRDLTALEAFKDLIWPTVERMNSFAPQHSRIFKEMVLVASLSKPFTYTAKGTARRQAVLKEYADEIEALYNPSESTSSNIEPPVAWDEENSKEFIQRVVATVLKRHVDDDADIFRFGCDSLQATWIRNQIVQALRTTVGDRSEFLPPNCVYQAPTIAELTRLVLSAAGTLQNGHIHESIPRAQVLRDIALRYTSTFPSRPTELLESYDGQDIVLLTGTTGGLGAHVLFHLLKDPTVGRVYALNRASASMKQQRNTFRGNGLDEDTLKSPKLKFLTGDLSQPSFGLDLSVYEDLRNSVTHIMHNAWKVDFNQGLNSYEPLLVGVRNLVHFSLSSPQAQAPSILFTSSMGVFRELPEVIPALEEQITDPSICVGPGYSESKWIAEEILLAAREKAGLKTVAARLGQVCGGYNGYWNEREWFPAIVKSALHVKCLPSLEGDADIAWIPAYATGLAMTQLRNSDEPILHIAHPKPVSWTAILTTIAADLGVDLVPYSSWLSALERAYPAGDTPDVDKLRENPALRLIDHFRTIEVGYGREPLGGVKMDVSKALREASALDMPQMTSEWAHRWMFAWRKCGFLPDRVV